MILKTLHVDGFGVHRDLRFEASPGLNVVVGPNEAGKTTLHDFVRGMLYGFRGKEGVHPPLRGGAFGGWLEVLGPDGPIRIERKGTGRKDLRVVLPGGAPGSQEHLDDLLRKTDAQLFRNVFAFGLDELAGFSGLTGAEMEMRLFDSSLSGAGRSASVLKGQLEAIRKEELSPRKGNIRELAATVDDLERRLREAKARVRGHAGLAAEEERLGRAIDEAIGKREDARSRAGRHGLLLGLWDEELRRRGAEAALRDLAPPVGGRLVIGDECIPRSLAGSEAEERRSGELPPGPEGLGYWERRLGTLEPRAGALQRDDGLQRERRQRLAALGGWVVEKRAAASRLLESLGATWTEARVRGIDRSLPRRQRLERLGAVLRDAEEGRAAARADLEAANREVSGAAGLLEECNAAIAAMKMPASAQELTERGGALAELRAARADREHAGRRLEFLRDQRRATGGGESPTRPIALAAGIGAAIFLVAAAIAWGAGESMAAGLGVVAALALALVAAGSRAAAHPGGPGPDPIPEAEEQLRRLGEAIATHAAAAGILGEPGAAVIETAADALQRERLLRDRWEGLLREREIAERRWCTAASSVSAAAEALARAREELRDTLDDWRDAVADLIDTETGHDGSPALSPDAALARLDRIGSTVEALDAAARDEAEVGRIRGEFVAWEAEVADLLVSAGIPGEGEAGLARLWEALETLRELRASTRAIDARLGAGEDASSAKAELASGDVDRWEAARRAAEVEEADRAAEVATLTEARALQRKEREDLERSSDVPRLSAELDRARTLLAHAARRWRRATILDRLLRAALDELRRERQPAVLRHAGASFARITAGRYASVEQTFDGDGIEVVEASSGSRIPASALSRGTRELLFICVRLGLAAAFAEQGTRLPLLLDDVFVNFDPARAAATAQVVADFAEGHQVLLFTCHPHTALRIRAAAPDATLLELSDGESGARAIA